MRRAALALALLAIPANGHAPSFYHHIGEVGFTDRLLELNGAMRHFIQSYLACPKDATHIEQCSGEKFGQLDLVAYKRLTLAAEAVLPLREEK